VTGKWQWDRKSKNVRRKEERKLVNEKQLMRRGVTA
jgi:hypothetical protein